MFCPRCGNRIADGAAFCPRCGATLDGPSSARPFSAPDGSTGTPARPVPVAGMTAAKARIPGRALLAVGALAVVAALVLVLASCLGDRGYAGAWEGTAESAGVRVDCTLELDEDGSGELRLSDGSRSEVLGPLEWREVEDGVEISNEGMDNWTLLERRGDTLVNERGTGGIAVEVTRQ